MDFLKLSDMLFPDVTVTPDELELKYPERCLPEGAKVTRIAPSPTGFFHIGGLSPLPSASVSLTSPEACFICASRIRIQSARCKALRRL